MNISGFEVNKQVVCIDDNFPAYENISEIKLPIKEKIYTIRDMRIGCHPKKIGILLKEIINPKMQFKYDPFCEPGF